MTMMFNVDRDFPQQCWLCGQAIASREDTEWHGLGNCKDICAGCDGSGEAGDGRCSMCEGSGSSESPFVQFFLDTICSDRVIGEPYLQNSDETRMFCPKCLEEIDPEPGYGLAFGGLGMYWLCDNCELCEWFYKIMDLDSFDNSGESNGREVSAQMSTDGMRATDRPKTEAGSILQPGVPAEGSPGDAQER